MNQLEIVNNVLLRMRKDTVTSVASSAYSKLIATLVNDAKRFCEDAHHWSMLWSSVELTTAASTQTYTVTGSNERSTIYQIIDQTNQNTLCKIAQTEFTKKDKLGVSADNIPTHYRVRGLTSGALSIDLWPQPNGTYTLWADCVIPQANFEIDGTTNTTELTIPWEPVALRAYAYAIKERGEDQGQSFLETLDLAKKSLGRAIALDRDHMPENRVWRVI